MFSTAFTFQGGLDPDAAKFIYYAGLTVGTQIQAVNRLVTDLKTTSDFWNRCKVFWPIVGGNATSHSFNLKDPTLYSISSYTNITHGATGMYSTTFNGHADTSWDPNTAYGSTQSASIVIYTIGTRGGGNYPYDIGCSQNTGGNSQFNLTQYQTQDQYANMRNCYIELGGVSSNTPGFQAVTSVQSGTDFVGVKYQGATQQYSVTVAEASLVGQWPSTTLSMCSQKYEDESYVYSGRSFAGGGCFDYLSQAEITSMWEIMNRYQTTLGRNV